MVSLALQHAKELAEQTDVVVEKKADEIADVVDMGKNDLEDYKKEDKKDERKIQVVEMEDEWDNCMCEDKCVHGDEEVDHDAYQDEHSEKVRSSFGLKN